LSAGLASDPESGFFTRLGFDGMLAGDIDNGGIGDGVIPAIMN
jgi:hypothetical protein